MKHRPFWGLAILALCLFMAVTTFGKNKVLLVDKLLAVVGISTITAGDVEVEKKILKLARDSLLYQGQERALTNKMVFRELLIRELLYQSATKLGLDQVRQKEVAAAMESFTGKFKNDDDYLMFLISLEVSDPKFSKRMEGSVEWVHYKPIEQRFKHKLIAQMFIEKKIGLQVRLTLPAKFENERSRLAAENPGKNDHELKGILERKMIQKGLRAWVKDAGSRTKISILVDDYSDVLN